MAASLEKVDAQLNKLTRRVDDLLYIKKMEQGQLQFAQSDFDFDTLVYEIIEEVQRTTETHQITLQGATDKIVRGDRERIGQVISNLLINAIKYSPDAQTVIVELSANGTSLVLSVRDYGIGIPLEMQEHLFERFYRVSGVMQNKISGLGLGLYISSEIVRKHNGHIWVESEVGKGSSFSFSLPTSA